MNVQALIAQTAKQLYGQTTDEAVAKSICVKCKAGAKIFRDDASRSEYQQSGFCQRCQDEFFK